MALERISLKAARVNAGLKQKDFASLIGVTQGTVSNWEQGRTSPSCSELEKISRVLQIAKDDIFFGGICTQGRKEGI